MTTAGGPSSSSLADVIDTILDKGLVIDAYMRVSLVGIELLTINARVVASVDTYLRFEETVNRLEIGSEPKGLSEIVSGATEGGAKSKTKARSNRRATSSAASSGVGRMRKNLSENECRANRLEVTGDGHVGADDRCVCLRHSRPTSRSPRMRPGSRTAPWRWSVMVTLPRGAATPGNRIRRVIRLARVPSRR